jgi:hypothetical protein
MNRIFSFVLICLSLAQPLSAEISLPTGKSSVSFAPSPSSSANAPTPDFSGLFHVSTQQSSMNRAENPVQNAPAPSGAIVDKTFVPTQPPPAINKPIEPMKRLPTRQEAESILSSWKGPDFDPKNYRPIFNDCDDYTRKFMDYCKRPVGKDNLVLRCYEATATCPWSIKKDKDKEKPEKDSQEEKTAVAGEPEKKITEPEEASGRPQHVFGLMEIEEEIGNHKSRQVCTVEPQGLKILRCDPWKGPSDIGPTKDAANDVCENLAIPGFKRPSAEPGGFSDVHVDDQTEVATNCSAHQGGCQAYLDSQPFDLVGVSQSQPEYQGWLRDCKKACEPSNSFEADTSQKVNDVAPTFR